MSRAKLSMLKRIERVEDIINDILNDIGSWKYAEPEDPDHAIREDGVDRAYNRLARAGDELHYAKTEVQTSDPLDWE